MWYLYILLMDNKKYYIGSTRDLKKRIIRHLSWMTKTTKWKEIKLIFSKKFDTYTEAYYWERYIKKLKSRIAIEKMINWQRKRNKDI